MVATVCKLSPAEILHYVDNIHDFPKAKMIRSIRMNHRQFEFDTQSLTSALQCVGFERCRKARTELPSLRLLAPPLCLPMFSRVVDEGGGILDWLNPEVEEACARLGEMTGTGLDWRPEGSFIHQRPEIPTGLVEV